VELVAAMALVGLNFLCSPCSTLQALAGKVLQQVLEELQCRNS
jgi:hypothetical protein